MKLKPKLGHHFGFLLRIGDDKVTGKKKHRYINGVKNDRQVKLNSGSVFSSLWVMKKKTW
jgi:hypothetical protein